MILLGYYLGKSIPGIENKIEYVIAVVVLISILPMLIKYIQHRIKQKGDAPRAPGPPSGS
jgi:membrane-associated protein